ncbi:RiPP maturation radical SAM protein 1 [Rhizobium binae]|uniref:RiPP maturation radical SAM C-methyltransferase n=1 Tax=Rhizobium binae TaxID=1138190 RepID=UPI001C838137|nr:RiPP maturation radical SAM C-methyltransferase [Rhizobium binae]MBX4952756.1 RiPP maturation radical SAM protein 1 [Rhizobium binae]
MSTKRANPVKPDASQCTLIAALPWNVADMISVQVASLKAFLCSKAENAAGRHYYLHMSRYFSQQEIDSIHEKLLGDHLYAMLLFPENAQAISEQITSRSGGSINPETCSRRLALFTDWVVNDIVALNPALIGFTTTHMQYCASIFTSKLIKMRNPHSRIVLGGIALHGEPALETLALFPWVDYIINGEGENSLWRLAQHCRGVLKIEDVPQVYYRDNGAVVQTIGNEPIESLDDLPFPDYSDYFHELQASGAAVIPRVTIEMGRGCRWGKCSFCIEGLASRKGFRAKSPDRVVKEITDCVEQYQVLDFVTADPDVAFYADVFKKIGDLSFDLNFMVELSGLVRPKHMEIMLRAGVRTVQIGIESFSPRLLAEFKKGVTLAKYVELLRMCKDRDVKLIYNNIYDAPFETQQDVDDAVENMRRLVYLQPPKLSQFRVSLGSEIIGNLAKYGIDRLRPAEEVTGYPEEVASKVGMLVSFSAGYQFDRIETLDPPNRALYLEQLEFWRQVWSAKPTCVARRGSDFIRVDHTVGGQRYHLTIADKVELQLFEFCQQLRKRKAVYQRFPELGSSSIDDGLQRLWAKNLVFVTEDECVALVSIEQRGGCVPQSDVEV